MPRRAVQKKKVTRVPHQRYNRLTDEYDTVYEDVVTYETVYVDTSDSGGYGSGDCGSSGE